MREGGAEGGREGNTVGEGVGGGSRKDCWNRVRMVTQQPPVVLHCWHTPVAGQCGTIGGCCATCMSHMQTGDTCGLQGCVGAREGGRPHPRLLPGTPPSCFAP